MREGGDSKLYCGGGASEVFVCSEDDDAVASSCLACSALMGAGLGAGAGSGSSGSALSSRWDTGLGWAPIAAPGIAAADVDGRGSLIVHLR